MSISITINTDTAAEARAALRELLGSGPATTQPKVDVRDVVAALVVDEKAFLGETSVPNDAGQQTTVATTRVPGQPSPGAKRRTKAEIAEDEAADRRAAESKGAYTQEMTEEFMAAQAAISTGEERVGPEDDVETVAADEADEAAETAAIVEERPADKKLTHDDVRNALGGYVKLYGMAAAQLDGPKVIALALKNPEIVKVSAIPETQEALKAVVAGIEEMTAKNPFGHSKVA